MYNSICILLLLCLLPLQPADHTKQSPALSLGATASGILLVGGCGMQTGHPTAALTSARKHWRTSSFSGQTRGRCGSLQGPSARRRAFQATRAPEHSTVCSGTSGTPRASQRGGAVATEAHAGHALLGGKQAARPQMVVLLFEPRLGTFQLFDTLAQPLHCHRRAGFGVGDPSDRAANGESSVPWIRVDRHRAQSPRARNRLRRGLKSRRRHCTVLCWPAQYGAAAGRTSEQCPSAPSATRRRGSGAVHSECSSVARNTC
mmetsp:Transcript_84166/g.234655  ORF Transcript_84166/g.234655 Transcript_84166/m.234655 type:complete len:260 (+) Transcript_84166:1074-1853(+)